MVMCRLRYLMLKGIDLAFAQSRLPTAHAHIVGTRACCSACPSYCLPPGLPPRQRRRLRRPRPQARPRNEPQRSELRLSLPCPVLFDARPVRARARGAHDVLRTWCVPERSWFVPITRLLQSNQRERASVGLTGERSFKHATAHTHTYRHRSGTRFVGAFCWRRSPAHLAPGACPSTLSR